MNPSIFTNVINSYLPEPHASLLNGILFGVSIKTTKAFYQQLKMVGLLHIVVLSGINITILASIVGSTTQFLPKKISIFITFILIVFFVLFVGPQAPIIRAAIMGILTLLAILYGRRALPIYLLFLSALLTAIFWPSWIKTVSFLLSYGATLGIILFGTIKIKTNPKNSIEKAKINLWREFKPSLAAQLFTAPIIFFYFRQISFIAPVSNILTSFIITPLMIFGFLTAILGKIHFLLGLLPGFISFILLSYLVLVIELLSKVPFAYVKF